MPVSHGSPALFFENFTYEIKKAKTELMMKVKTLFPLVKELAGGGGGRTPCQHMSPACITLFPLFSYIQDTQHIREYIECCEITEVKMLPHQSHPPKLFLY